MKATLSYSSMNPCPTEAPDMKKTPAKKKMTSASPSPTNKTSPTPTVTPQPKRSPVKKTNKSPRTTSPEFTTRTGRVVKKPKYLTEYVLVR